MPLVPNFWLALRLRFFTRFRRGFYRLILLAAISGCLILCAAISKTVTSASSATAASAPLARAFTLLLLRSALFGGRALRGFLLRAFIFLIADRDRRHDFLRLNRPVLSLCAAHLNDG